MGLAVGLTLVYAACAVADWVAIARGELGRRPLTKTAATVVLVVIAAVAGDMAGDARVALVVAVVLCLAGDVALLDHGDARFLIGLSAFAAAHACYVVTAVLVGVSWPRLAIAFPILAVLLGFQVATKMLPAVRSNAGTTMVVAVAAYTLIIAAMVVTASGTPSWFAFAGATLFAVSDSVIAYDRFVRPFPGADLPIMITYHAGQLLLVGGLIAGG